MADHLQEIIQRQRSFIAKWIDLEAIDRDPALMEQWALDQINHAIEELVELRKEFPSRKHWKKVNPPVNIEKAKDEFSDVLHFVVNIGLVIGVRDSESYRAVYEKKHETNLVRQQTGY